MAVIQERKLPLGSLRGPQLLVLYLAGLLAVYIGERLIGGEGTTRWLTIAAGSGAVLISCLVWGLAWLRSQAEARRVERLSFLLAFSGLLSLLLYFLGSDLVLGPAPLAKTGEVGVSLRQIWAAAWPILMFCSVLPLLFVQASANSMARGRGVEALRVRASAQAGATIAMLLCTLFLVNALVNDQDVHTDLSYFKTASPSEASRGMVQGLAVDTEALLFFPKINEVLEQVRPYFDELAEQSSHFAVRVIDRALEPEMARKHRVSSDGTVLLLRKESKQKITLGAKIDRAKRNLRKLDQEFQKAMLKLTQSRETVYLVTGHGERGMDRSGDDVRSGITVLKKFLMALNLTVKNISAVEGLANGVPEDAALVLWLDPTGPLFPGEEDALRAYLAQGGRMLITLDPDSPGAAGELLAYLGVKYSPAKLAHLKGYVPLTRTKADRYNLVSNSFSAHPSVSTLSRSRNMYPILFPGTGSLEKAEKTHKKTVFIVKAMPQTWQDSDGDRSQTPPEESRAFALAAAVSEKIAAKKDQAKALEPSKDSAAKSEREMRAVVFADADLFSDKFIGFRLGYSEVGGNMQLLVDVLRWLTDEGRVPGLASSEEDVKIVHTRDEDVFWFYGTVFAVPLLILGLGLFTRWGRGRKRKVTK